MIFLWIKIMWYKIVKQIRHAISAYDNLYRHLKNPAATGTETGASRVRVGLDPSAGGSVVRVRGSGNITAGGDLSVTEISSEISRLTSEDVDHASEVAVWRREQLLAVRPSAEIDPCGVCGHPRHPSNVFWCPGSVPSGDPSGGTAPCRCDGTRILGEDGPA